jgi:hypothetical protein
MLLCRVFLDDLALRFVTLSRFRKRLVKLSLLFLSKIGLTLFHRSRSRLLVLLGGSCAASPRAGRWLFGLAAAFSFLSTRRTRQFAVSIFANHAFGFLCHVSFSPGLTETF